MNEDGERSVERDLRASAERAALDGPGASTDSATTMDHPTAEALRRFMEGVLAPSEMRQVFRHLLQGCQECQAKAGEVWNVGPTGGLIGGDPALPAAAPPVLPTPPEPRARRADGSRDAAAHAARLRRV